MSLSEALARVAAGAPAIDLRACSIDGAGAARLAAALELSATVTSVNLVGASVCGVCGRRFQCSCVGCVAENKMGKEGATAIAGALQLNTSITIVDLSGARHTARAFGRVCGFFACM